MGNRQGERTELLQHVAEVEKGSTRDIASSPAIKTGLQEASSIARSPVL